MTPPLRIATRKSALAMWQAEHVQSLLVRHHPGLAVELLPMVTRGDRIVDRPLAEIGGKGLFLKELERALISGEADLAVHSMKDVPAEMTPGLCLEVMLPRATPFDAWISRDGRGVDAAAAGSRVGTSSLRRRCQLLASRPQLEVVEMRGNVDTRLSKLARGECEAIILACAGLERLGLGDRITQVLAPPTWLPAATQGIIGLQCRSRDRRSLDLIRPLGDANAALQAEAERAVAGIMQASCQVPLAVFADLDGQALDVSALVGTPDGGQILRARRRGAADAARRLGEEVAADLLRQGAGEIIAGLKGE